MKRYLLTLLLVALVPVCFAQKKSDDHDLKLKPHVVISFDNNWYPYFNFSESIAADRQGNLYVSQSGYGENNPCQIVKFTPEGKHKEVVATIDPSICPSSFMTGLAFDERQRLHVAVKNYVTTGLTGVYRVMDDRTLTQVLQLPVDTFPNGVAFYGDDLFVSDEWNSRIYRKRPHDPIVAGTPWYQNPDFKDPFTAPNGIAFYRDALYVALSWAGHDVVTDKDLGSIVRIKLRHDGSPGKCCDVVAPPDARLAWIDGIAFDVTGKLWFTVNRGSDGMGGKLGTLDEDGKLRILADDPGWLDYPTQVVFGTSRGTHDTLFLSNGGVGGYYQPNVISLKVGVAGVELPAEH
jgi:sugar lactone lactonase YvrE